MATYNYDESGNMAAYFIITFLAFILIPLTLSTLTKKRQETLNRCQCGPCIQSRSAASKVEGTTFTTRHYILAVGWAALFFLVHRAANATNDNKLYDPYEILGVKIGTPEKEIKSHFKKLSKLFHPDKVKATAEMTLEDIQNKFVDLTKAYKSLTDETIRRNWEEFGDPDGRQQMSMGIALPTWIIEGKNNIWVLGVYGLLFGGGLPLLVGRWWFGSRSRTKEGVSSRSAAEFFKSITETSDLTEAFGVSGKAFKFECTPAGKDKAELARLEKEIQASKESKWLSNVAYVAGKEDDGKKRALTLLFAHLLRLNVKSAALRKEQRRVVLHTPTLLNALLTVATARNWLVPTLAIMRLNAYVAQALLPSQSSVAQLPGVKPDEVTAGIDVPSYLKKLEANSDSRASDIRKATEKWGKVELVDASLKVIDERQITPSAIVHLVVKLRLTSPITHETPISEEDATLDQKANDKKDYQFLTGKKEIEDLPGVQASYAHAPYWPGNRKPSWWIVLADPRTQRLAIPPMKITDIPFLSDVPSSRPFRSYKIQFQAPPNVSVNSWRVIIVSDSFVGEEVWAPITMRVEEPAAVEEAEDDISEPDEDTLAGQMAIMKGGKVKKVFEEESDDDESGTDDEEVGDDDSSSDSD